MRLQGRPKPAMQKDEASQGRLASALKWKYIVRQPSSWSGYSSKFGTCPRIAKERERDQERADQRWKMPHKSTRPDSENVETRKNSLVSFLSAASIHIYEKIYYHSEIVGSRLLKKLRQHSSYLTFGKGGLKWHQRFDEPNGKKLRHNIDTNILTVLNPLVVPIGNFILRRRYIQGSKTDIYHQAHNWFELAWHDGVAGSLKLPGLVLVELSLQHTLWASLVHIYTVRMAYMGSWVDLYDMMDVLTSAGRRGPSAWLLSRRGTQPACHGPFSLEPNYHRLYQKSQITPVAIV